jgi:hypothetical protein
MTTDPQIDYSCPVGWWCPVCKKSYDEYGTPGLCAMRGALCCCNDPSESKRDLFLWIECIPVYLPLPTPEPVEVDEVETGEAEVVTWTPPRMDEPAFSTPFGWTAFSDSVEEIQKICTATDEIINARKKRGMK